jgi:hypothetical protein
MHKLLSTIQAISQKRLKGRPKIIGSMRSQSETERHIAMKGIRPSRRAPADGFLTRTVGDYNPRPSAASRHGT